MRYLWVISACILLIALTACQPASSTELIPTSTETATAIPGVSTQNIPAQTVTPTSELATEGNSMDPILDEAAQKMIALVKEHLAKKLGISVEQVAVSQVKPVVWRDASLGCPRPNIDFLPVDTPGYNIFLQAQGETYNYHTDKVKRFVVCRT